MRTQCHPCRTPKQGSAFVKRNSSKRNTSQDKCIDYANTLPKKKYPTENQPNNNYLQKLFLLSAFIPLILRPQNNVK